MGSPSDSERGEGLTQAQALHPDQDLQRIGMREQYIDLISRTARSPWKCLDIVFAL